MSSLTPTETIENKAKDPSGGTTPSQQDPELTTVRPQPMTQGPH